MNFPLRKTALALALSAASFAAAAQVDSRRRLAKLQTTK